MAASRDAAASNEPADSGHVCVRPGFSAPTNRSWFYLGYPGAGRFAKSSREVARALEKELGIDARCVKVIVLPHEDLVGRYRTLSHRAPLGPTGTRIDGFHQPVLGTDSTVFVEDVPEPLFQIVLTHEVLHTYSHRFSSEAGNRRLSHLVEGVTEWFTRRTASRQLGVHEARFPTGYRAYLAFADRLAHLVGAEVLERCFLRDGYLKLEHEAAGARGEPTLREAARALQGDDARAAISLLLD
jgi:hypothetical protein